MLITWLYLFSSLMNGGSAPAAAVPAAPVLFSAMALPSPLPAKPSTPWQLQGIRLGETTAEVKQTRGVPAKSESDPLQSGCETWSYREGTNVGFCEGAVSFVQVTAKAGTANVTGEDVAMTDKALREAFGKPDYVAEDGWGILGKGEALKVFNDDFGKAVSLDLFFDPCGI